jgi:hypothetical protein
LAAPLRRIALDTTLGKQATALLPDKLFFVKPGGRLLFGPKRMCISRLPAEADHRSLPGSPTPY